MIKFTRYLLKLRFKKFGGSDMAKVDKKLTPEDRKLAVGLMSPGSKFGEVLKGLAEADSAKFALFLVAVTGAKEARAIARYYDLTCKAIKTALKLLYVHDRQIRTQNEKLSIEQPKESKLMTLLSLIQPIPERYV